MQFKFLFNQRVYVKDEKKKRKEKSNYEGKILLTE